MKPIKLEMQAFGPYAHKTVVDFSKLGNNGLYLITGNTGVGKTTIFDAIVFALYGTPSGDHRETDGLRCRNLTDEEDKKNPTKVTLEFEYRGKKYTVSRSPAFKYRNNKSETLAKAELTTPDGSITGVKPVNAKIEEIIGLKKDQFSQIAMIAQGEFLKLLTNSTSDRIKILRHVFKTKRFYDVEDGLKKLKERAENDLGNSNIEKETCFDSIKCSEDSAYFEQFEELYADSDFEDILDFLSKIIKEDKKLKKEKDQECKEKTNELNSFEVKIKEAQRKESINKEILALDEQIKKQDQEAKKYDEAHKKAKEKEKVAEDNRKRASVIESKLSKYDELDKVMKDRDANLKSIKNIDAFLNKNKPEYEKLDQGIKADKEEISKLKSENLDTSKLTADKTKLENKLTQINNIFDDIEDLNKQKQKLVVEQETFQNLKKESDKNKDIYDKSHNDYMLNQAGILAEDLQDNQPCPVCGSVHHPHKASKTSKVCTKEELDRLKAKADGSLAKTEDQAKKCNTVQTECKTKEGTILKQSKELLAVPEITFEMLSSNLEVLQNKSETDKKKICARISDMEKKKKHLEDLEKNIDKKSENLQKLSRDIDQKNSDLKVCKVNENNFSSRLETLKGELEFGTKKEAKDKIVSLMGEADEIAQAIKISFDKANNCRTNCATLNATKVTKMNDLSQIKETESVQNLTAIKKDMSAENDALRKAFGEISGRLTNNEKIRESLEKNKEETAQKVNKLKLITNLWNVVNGKGTKIRFETYILMGYLDCILKKANQRLFRMTNERYELVRREDVQGNGYQGLELDVIDHYNTVQRDVKTLSGGESFQASLSLALGLADTIQENAGGIQLDTMFVDEGFGSLDDETLKNAVSTLTALANQNKFVGIISHVNELKARIDKKILVAKDSTGNVKINVQAE